MKFRVGQGLLYAPATGRTPYMIEVEKVGKRWLYCAGGLQIDRKTMDAKANRGFAAPGRAWLTKDCYDRAQRKHSAWRHFRRQVQDKWTAPETVTLEQIQAACDLLRLSVL